MHCKWKFRSENSKVLHSLCHQNDSKDYKCSEKNCDFITPRWNACRSHLWKIHKIDIDMFSCQVRQSSCKIILLNLKILHDEDMSHIRN